MNPWQDRVREFSEATGGGTIETPEGRLLRAKLIMEEAVETASALGFDVAANIYDPTANPSHDYPLAEFEKKYGEFHLLDFIDGMCDLSYVTLGSAVVAGIDLDPHFAEVHRANMAKLGGKTLDGPLGYKTRADGKVLKPADWTPPDHAAVMDRVALRGKPALDGPQGFDCTIDCARNGNGPFVHEFYPPYCKPREARPFA